MHKQIHYMFLMLGALMFGGMLTAAQVDFGEGVIRKSERGFQILNAKGKTAAWVSTVPGDGASKIECRYEAGNLVVDSGDFIHRDKPTQKLVLRFYGPVKEEGIYGEKDTFPERLNCYDLPIQGPASAKVILRFEGERSEGNKHFISRHDFTLDGPKQKLTVKDKMPPDMKRFWMVLIIQSSGVYTIGAPHFFTEEKERVKIDTTVNHLPNGGAEHGFYGTMFIPPRARAVAPVGKIRDWRGRWEEPFEVDLALDSNQVRSGKYSYRFRINASELPSTRGGIFLFQPVPYVPGEAIDFSIYLKADRPAEVMLELTFGNGVGVSKKVALTTEWKKYELFVPVWGKPGDDFVIQRQILNTFHMVAGLLIPKVTIPNNVTVWMDDAAVFLGAQGEFRDTSGLYFRQAKLDRDCALYFPGEPIRPTLTIEGSSDTPENYLIRYEIFDFFGNRVMRSGERKPVVKKGKLEEQSFVIKLPEHLRGPFNLVFTAEGERSGIVTRNFYFGVVEKAGVPNKRISLELGSSQDVRELIGFLKTFGIGTIRNGGASGELEIAAMAHPYLRQANIDVMLNYSISADRRKNPDKTMEQHLQQFRDFITKNAAHMQYLETENESNLFMSGKEARELLKAQSKIVREIAPHLKMVGPAACGTDFTWIENALIDGGADALDIVSEHPYRVLPEEPDYGDDSLAVRRLLDHYKPSLLHFASECGSVQPPALTDNLISGYMRKTTAIDLRSLLQGLGNGVSCYNHFSLQLAASGMGWNSLIMGSVDNNGKALPAPILFALRNAGDRLGDGKAAGRIMLGHRWRGLLFDKGESRCAVIWKHKGEPALLKFSPADAEKVRVFDMVGTELPGGSYLVNEYPLYFESKLSTEELSKLIRSYQVHDATEPALALESKRTGADSVKVQLRNISSRTLQQLQLVFSPASQIDGEAKIKLASLAPGADQAYTILLKDAERLPSVAVQVTGENMPQQTLTIKLADLLVAHSKSNRPSLVKMGKEELTVLTPEESAYLAKCSAEVESSWDDHSLNWTVKVKSPEFHPKPDEKDLAKLWQFDSIQFGFDTLANGKESDRALQDDDFEYAAGEVAGKPVVYRWKSPSVIHDSLTKETGVANEVELTLEKRPGEQIYRFRFPRRAVSPFKLQNGSVMRSNILVNFHRNGKRIGYMQLTPGLGDIKCPGKWKNTVLLPLQEADNRVNVLNLGVGGANSEKVLRDQLSKALEADPTLAIVLVGTNDSCNSYALISPEKFRDNLNTLLSELEKNKTSIILMTPPPFSESLLLERHAPTAYKDQSPTRRAEAIRQIIREEAAKNNRLLLDLEPLFAKYGVDGKESLLTNPANSPHRDGLHPNQAGYEKIAAELAVLIRKHSLNTNRIVCLGDSITFGARCSKPGTSDGDSYPALLKRNLQQTANK